MLLLGLALVGLLTGPPAVLIIRNGPGSGPLLARLPCSACGTDRPRWSMLRCRTCRAAPPMWHHAVALALAAVGLGLGLTVGWSAELPAYAYLGLLSVVLAVIDVRVNRLPNRIVLPSYPLVAALLTVPALAGPAWLDYGRAALGGAVMFAGYYGLARVSRGGMGWGDVKLSGVLGLCLGYLGWAELWAGVIGAFGLGALLGLVLLLLPDRTRQSTFPFGPSMLLAALGVSLVGLSP